MIHSLQLAKLKDIPTLVSHHQAMFEEIYKRKGESIEKGRLDEMNCAYQQKLAKQLSDNSCIAWIIHINEIAVSSGAVSIMSLVPTPQDPNTSVAYIHSIFTVPEYRGRGFASQILNSILDYCKCAKIKRVQLSASDAGRSLYEKSGFKPADSSMVLNFE